MIRGVFPHLAESWRSHAWSAMAMAKGEGMGSGSFPTGQGVLGANRHQTRCLLYQTLLGAPTKGCVQKEGKGLYLAHDHFLDDMAVRIPMLDAWDQFVWPPSVAVPWTTMKVEQYGYHSAL